MDCARRDWPADDAEFMAAWEAAEQEANAGCGYCPNDAFLEANIDASLRYERLLDRIWGLDDSDVPLAAPKPELGPAVDVTAAAEPPTAAMHSELAAVFAAARR